MTKLRVAVSGVGSLGQHHARIAAASERTELVAVVDPSEARGREIAAKFGTSWVASLAEVLPRVDAVQIAAPRASIMPSGFRSWRLASTCSWRSPWRPPFLRARPC